MAFNDYMMASMGYGPNALETEEERKRREEEAAKARNIAAPVAPVAPVSPFCPGGPCSPTDAITTWLVSSVTTTSLTFCVIFIKSVIDQLLLRPR